MTVTFLWQRKDGTWVKLIATRSHTRLRPAWREQGSSSWGDRTTGEQKFLVRRWHAEIGKLRFALQTKPPMTEAERAQWVSPSHLEKSRSFH